MKTLKRVVVLMLALMMIMPNIAQARQVEDLTERVIKLTGRVGYSQDGSISVDGRFADTDRANVGRPYENTIDIDKLDPQAQNYLRAMEIGNIYKFYEDSKGKIVRFEPLLTNSDTFRIKEITNDALLLEDANGDQYQVDIAKNPYFFGFITINQVVKVDDRARELLVPDRVGAHRVSPKVIIGTEGITIKDATMGEVNANKDLLIPDEGKITRAELNSILSNEEGEIKRKTKTDPLYTWNVRLNGELVSSSLSEENVMVVNKNTLELYPVKTIYNEGDMEFKIETTKPYEKNVDYVIIIRNLKSIDLDDMNKVYHMSFIIE